MNKNKFFVNSKIYPFFLNFRYLPYLGIITILLNDYPMLKYGLIGMMSLLVLIAKDPQS